MPASLATVDKILKEIYEGDIRDQLMNDAIGLRRIERTSEGITHEVGGKYVTFPVRVRRNHGVGARIENEALPTAGQQGYNAARVSLKYLYGALELTGQTFELAEKNFQAFSSALDQEISGLKSDLAVDQNRQFYGSTSGVLATATAAGSGVLTFTALGGTKYIEEGMAVDIIPAAQMANATPTPTTSNRVVTAVNHTTGVVTFTGATFSSAIGDVMVRYMSANRETTGLADIVKDTGALFTIDPATEPKWAAFVDANGGTNRPLSEGLMIQQVDKVRQAGGKTSVIFTGLGVRRSYFNLLVQQRRFTNTEEFDGGFRGLAFTTDQGDVPLIVDTMCPNNLLYFLDEKQIKLYRESEWSFMNRDGSNWQRKVGASGSFDAYQAMYYMYCEMGTHKRNAHAVLKDITES